MKRKSQREVALGKNPNIRLGSVGKGCGKAVDAREKSETLSASNDGTAVQEPKTHLPSGI